MCKNQVCRTFLCFLLVGLLLPLSAQNSEALPSIDFNNFPPVISSGKVPTEFLTESVSDYRKRSSEIDRSEASFERNSKDQFYLENSFLYKELIFGGKVVFNDPLSQYVEKIADILLQDDPKLREQLRFYLFRSSSINAFTTDDGAIFINVGLLAKLENEAQLAYVISHEIIHYTESHIVDYYVESASIDEDRLFERSDPEEKLIAKSSYSQEQELEADQKGLAIFLNSPYSQAEIVPCFSHLESYNLPFANTDSFELSFFESTELQFPDDYLIPADNDEYNVRDEDKSDYSTHPSIDERIEKISQAVSPSTEGGQLYVLPEEQFQLIKKMAQFELCRIFIEERNYEYAIFCALQLIQLHQEQSVFLDQVISYSLYAIAREETQSRLRKSEKERMHESVAPLAYFLDEAKRDLRFRIAIEYMRGLESVNTDPFMSMIYTETVTRYGYKYKRYVEKALEDGRSSGKKTMDSEEEDPPTEREMLEDESLLASWYTDTMLVRLLRLGIASSAPEQFEATSRFWSVNQLPQGDGFDVDKLVVLDPIYWRINTKREQSMRYLSSDKYLSKLKAQIYNCAEKLNMEIIMVSPGDLKADDVAMFNEMNLLKFAAAEYEQNTNDEISMLSFRGAEMKALSEKYGTSHFSLIGSISVSQRNKSFGEGFVLAYLYPVLLPLAIVNAFNPDIEALYFLLLYDLSKDRKLAELLHVIDNRDSEASILTATYYHLLQIR